MILGRELLRDDVIRILDWLPKNDIMRPFVGTDLGLVAAIDVGSGSESLTMVYLEQDWHG